MVLLKTVLAFHSSLSLSLQVYHQRYLVIYSVIYGDRSKRGIFGIFGPSKSLHGYARGFLPHVVALG